MSASTPEVRESHLQTCSIDLITSGSRFAIRYVCIWATIRRKRTRATPKEEEPEGRYYTAVLSYHVQASAAIKKGLREADKVDRPRELHYSLQRLGHTL